MCANHLATWSIEVEWRNHQLPQKEKKQFCIYLDCSSKVNALILVNSSGVSTTCWRRSAGAEEKRGRHPSREALGSALLSLHFSAQSRSLKNVNQAAAFWFSSEDIVRPSPRSSRLTCIFAYCAGAERQLCKMPSAPCFSSCQWKLWPLQIFDLTSIHAPVLLLCVFFLLVNLYCCSLCCHNIIIIVGDSS